MKNSYNNKKFFIVVPAFKSAHTLPKTIKRIPQNVYDFIKEIVIVEDINNIDQRSTSKEFLEKYKKCHVIYHDKNKGYGAAQKTGYSYCMKNNCDGVVLLHSDGQYDPIYLEQFLDLILNDGIDVVQGSRMIITGLALKGGMPLYKYWLNKIITKIENMIYKTKYSEFHSGYMSYSNKALKNIAFEKLSDKFHFDGEMLIMTKLKGLVFKEISINTYYGKETSSLNPIYYGWQIILVIIKYLFNYYNFSVDIKRFD